jgi:hypothetical protein
MSAFLGAKRTLTNRCLPISIYEYTACSLGDSLELRRLLIQKPLEPNKNFPNFFGSSEIVSALCQIGHWLLRG